MGDQPGVAFDHLAEHGQVGFGLGQAGGEVATQHVLAELLQQVVLLGVIEVLEVTEAHMALRQA
ncbi:hypothetical protein D3C72_2336310 [compost metagenome]